MIYTNFCFRETVFTSLRIKVINQCYFFMCLLKGDLLFGKCNYYLFGMDNKLNNYLLILISQIQILFYDNLINLKLIIKHVI